MTKYTLKLFLLLQFILLLTWFFGNRFIPVKTETFLGRGLGEEAVSSLVWSRANFDGFYYTKIARDGYQYLQQAFFPFYPELIKFFYRFFNSFIVSGIFISNLSFFFLMIVLGKLLALEGIKKGEIKKTLLFLTLFPTSFFFLCIYNESLFLFLVLSSFYLARKRKFFWAGVVAGFASYTRLVGIFLFPALIAEYWQQTSKRTMKDRLVALKERITHPRRNHFLYLLSSRLPHFKSLFFISLSSWGILKYMSYLKTSCGDPFYFIKVQPDFGAQRTVKKLILLYQVFWRYAKMIFTVTPRQWIYFVIWLELLISLLFLFLLLWGWFRKEEYKIRVSWLMFASLAYLLPPLTGTFSSMPRYVLVCFPCWIVLTRFFSFLRKKKIYWPERIFLFATLALLLICSAFFFRGYWIA